MPISVRENKDGNMTATNICFNDKPDVKIQFRTRSDDHDQLATEIKQTAYRMNLMGMWDDTPGYEILEQFSYDDGPTPVSGFMPESLVDVEDAKGHYNLIPPDVP